MQWMPQAPGSYTLEIKAYNSKNQVNEPKTISVSAVADGGSGTPTPTPTPATPTATISSIPGLRTLTDLNVRSGPGTFYDLVGLLPAGSLAEIVGRDEGRQWWQVRFNLVPGGLAWVAADPDFSETANVENVPVVPPPPTPTGTPTNTPSPTATSTDTPTPTSTPVPVTNTPTPTFTPTTPSPPDVSIEFDADPTEINGGECTQVTWKVTGVKAVYYQDQGVAGEDRRKECPPETTTYRLRDH
jgi:uncharacterized protein YraI